MVKQYPLKQEEETSFFKMLDIISGGNTRVIRENIVEQ